MQTLYEVKQNTCFRCFYKAPHGVKNFLLMVVLSAILLIMYALYFRPDQGNY